MPFGNYGNRTAKAGTSEIELGQLGNVYFGDRRSCIGKTIEDEIKAVTRRDRPMSL